MREGGRGYRVEGWVRGGGHDTRVGGRRKRLEEQKVEVDN